MTVAMPHSGVLAYDIGDSCSPALTWGHPASPPPGLRASALVAFMAALTGAGVILSYELYFPTGRHHIVVYSLGHGATQSGHIPLCHHGQTQCDFIVTNSSDTMETSPCQHDQRGVEDTDQDTHQVQGAVIHSLGAGEPQHRHHHCHRSVATPLPLHPREIQTRTEDQKVREEILNLSLMAI